MKHFLCVIILLAVCTQVHYAQQNHVTSVQGSTFFITIDTSAYNYTDTAKGKFIVRDYYNFSNPSLPGTYTLPYRNIILAIPPYSKPVVQVVNKQETILQNYVPATNPQSALTNDSTIIFKNIGYKNIENYKPQNIVEVVGYFWYRDFYCVNLRINDCYFDQNSSRIVQYKNLKLSLGFTQPITQNSPIKIISDYDKELKNLIYDSDIAEQFRTSPKLILNDSTGSWFNYNSTYVKLGVVNDGLFRIYKGDLANLGVNVNGINPKTFQLFLYGKEVPVFVKDENTGVFSDSDYIEFYGTKNYPSISYRTINAPNQNYNEYLNRYTDTSVYFLTWGNQNGIRANIDSVFNASTADTLNYYTRFQHYEKNTMEQNLYDDQVENQTPGWIRNRSWYWTWLFVGKSSYTFQAPNLYPNEPANFYFKLVSAGSNVSTNSHNVILSVNNTTLDSEVVNRYQQVVLHGTLNSNKLITGNNQLYVQNYDNGTSPNYFAIDWYDIEYPSYLTMQNDSLYFRVSDDVIRQLRIIKISNVTDTNLIIYKVKPNFTRILNYVFSSNNLYFTDTVGAGDTYIVISPSKILKPVFYYQKQFVDLRNSSNQADYIAITHPDFMQSASNYIQKISSLYSVSAKLINADDIYDEFGFGFPTPESIKLFLETAYQNWQSPKPSYLTIIGDADYDYKHYVYQTTGVAGGGNFVPSYGDPVSDNWYAIWDDSTLAIPQMMVGRIPIDNSADLDYYLSKVENNYNQNYDEFNKRYLLFSGGDPTVPYQIDQLKAVNDTIISQLLAPKPIAGEYSHFYKTTTPTTNFGPYTADQVQSAISNGGVFISYIGHSGTATWDNSINETTQLQNSAGKSSLITDFGCSTNKFAEPDIVSFGERFLLSSTGQAIAYLGNSSLGFTTTATTVPPIFYRTLLFDSLHQVGATHLNAKIQMFNEYGSSQVFNVFSYTNTLLGDPVIQIKIPNKPNLEIQPSDISFDNTITANQDSTLARFIVHNFGIVNNDTVQIAVVHTMPDKSTETKNITIQMPDAADTISVWLKVKSTPGTHTLQVTVDPNNYIDEIYKTDNTAQTSFFVASASLNDLIAYKIENSALNYIDILNPTIYTSPNFNILVQASQQPDFQTYSQYIDSSKPFVTRLNFTNLSPGSRYWTRYKIDDQNSIFSQPKSFYNSGNYKFYLADSLSFDNQINHNTGYTNGNFHLTQDSVKLTVVSKGSIAGASCIIMINGDDILPSTYFSGMGIAVFDQKTLALDTVTYYYLFGEPSNVQQLADFINSIPLGRIVVMGVSDDAANNMTAALKTAIKTLGSTLIDSLKFRDSWAIIGQKGAIKGTVQEGLQRNSTGIPVTLDSTFYFQPSNGIMSTNNIGPASKWQSLHVVQNIPGDGTIKYQPLGIKIDGSVDTLSYLTITDSTADLSFIDAGKYPDIKLLANIQASSTGVSPSINSVGINYTGLPELGTNYQVVSISKDSVLLGNNENLQFYVYNIGEAPADSFNVLVNLVNQDGSKDTLLNQLVDSLNSGSRKLFNINYTPLKPGIKTFSINIDPNDKVREIYKDNNIFNKSFSVYIDSTTLVSSASVSVTFDGNNIYNGDYVSSDPEIMFKLKYGFQFPYRDTSQVSYFIDNNPIYYSEMSPRYDTINMQVIDSLRIKLKDGQHVLSITGNNLVNQPQDLQKMFYVSSGLKVMNIYNYPDPFNSYTYFTFTLTEIPDQLNIRIYTVAGRLIKEINVPSSSLRNNFNKIYWDGRDQDGDLAANGVYFYKIYATLADKTYTSIQKLAIVR